MDMYKKIYEIHEMFKKEISINAYSRCESEYSILYCRRAKTCLKFYKILKEYDIYYTSYILDEILDIYSFDKQRYEKYKEMHHIILNRNTQERWNTRKEKSKLQELYKNNNEQIKKRRL